MKLIFSDLKLFNLDSVQSLFQTEGHFIINLLAILVNFPSDEIFNYDLVVCLVCLHMWWFVAGSVIGHPQNVEFTGGFVASWW